MADAVFAHPRLAAIYDPLDPDRGDLDAYVALVAALDTRSVVDLGCGTGTFALLLAARGIDVVGVDPAEASLEVARRKPGADRVRWLAGDATALATAGVAEVDAVTMTANVAQAIVDPDDWAATLRIAHHVLRPGGHLVFETRDPAARAWRGWRRSDTHRRVDLPGVGRVETWTDVLEVSLPLVVFRHSFVFADGERLTSESTLRFRARDEVLADLAHHGFGAVEVRDAPDRPGREWVFVASRPA